MATEIHELVAFLSSPSHQLKKAAVDIVRGLTGSEDELLMLAACMDALLPALSQLLNDEKDVAEPAVETLVNLSQKPELSDLMVANGLVKTAMDMLYKKNCSFKKLFVMLLLNLTQLDSGITSLLQLDDENMQGLYVAKLVRSFSRHSTKEEEDSFEHVGSILVNISKMEKGRKILLDPKWSLLKQAILQFDSPSLLRKKGVVGTIRNCCFDSANHLQDLLLMSEFLWPALLLAVAGKKVYDEVDRRKMPLELATALSIEREAIDDPDIRVKALEAIYLISVQEAGLRALWSVNGPRILEVGYEDEEDPAVLEAYEQIGSLLVHGDHVQRSDI